jgi:PKD repeat protein
MKWVTVLLPAIILLAACRKEVSTDVTVDFSYEVVNSDFSIPVKIAFSNNTKGAQYYTWTFEGGLPGSYDKKEPGTITFNKAGSIKVKLEAWNDEQRKEKEITILLDSVVHADFNIAADTNNFGPTSFLITNNSAGVTQYKWTFENAAPATATGRNPAPVRYSQPGTYKIYLESSNERGEKDTLSKFVTVRPALSASFDIEPSFDDDDYEAPLTATLQNKSISATQHQWSATGGAIANTTDSITTIYFANAGTYTVTYKAGNGKQTQTITKNITVKPNTGLRSFTNIKLGINTAHATIGSFFSTRLRKVFKQGEVTALNGDKIDLVYFGLSESFNYNHFIRPDSALNWTFTAIPNATVTKIINSQELCGCGTGFSSNSFDNVTSGSAFDGVSVSVTQGGVTPFNNSIVPRIILFENAAGKKGAIKIKQFVQDGQQSYILCDIKVQKD